MDWASFLASYRVNGVGLFDEAFLRRWGPEKWEPTNDDRLAAGQLHTQIVSRIATQRLDYLTGVERAALQSLHALFDKTRDIVDAHPQCRHFETVTWHVMNTCVRPFTAKWHRQSERDLLAALDATDEFRAQLTDLQQVLQCFDDLLLHLRDGKRPPPAVQPAREPQADVAEEMEAGVKWGIPSSFGGIDPLVAARINESERKAVRARRQHYAFEDKPYAVALALSGGGIRSATFSLGVLVALAKRGLLSQFDYLSTVSGGGYLGSFLSAFLQSPGEEIGLRSDELPFKRKEGEAAAIRHIRHHSKYLATGSFWQRVKMACAQLYGMAINSIAVGVLVVFAVALERRIRLFPHTGEAFRIATYIATGAVVLGALLALVALRSRSRWQQSADALVAIPVLILLALLSWRALGMAHTWFGNLSPQQWTWRTLPEGTWLALLGAIPVVTSSLTVLLGRLRKGLNLLLLLISSIAAPLFLLGFYLVMYRWAGTSNVEVPFFGATTPAQVEWVVVALGVLFLAVLDINFTSPHRHYRNKLAEAYLIQPNDQPTKEGPFKNAGSVRLSDLGVSTHRAPYHLINCALNVPASQNQHMQGRLTDFFVFSPAYCGSPLTGYHETKLWEQADAHLDLGTAMAISGAAAAPQMGLISTKSLSFWLALLNIRLGYWAHKPGSASHRFVWPPGLLCLLKEMTGRIDERGRWLNLTDGGHIENLGIYELLRRRCKYILAIDGEQDPQMTFKALTTLQRLAAIDLGVRIDIDLDDLRLNEKGLSRSHFRFCRIRYPKEGRGSEDEFGYLLYLKLSLTGNEGEFIRRYRMDEPVFPHHSTADQFFSEAQFEAYRSLGEHIGDKLFLRAIVGDVADLKQIEVGAWFRELGKTLLDPLSAPHS